MIDIRENYEIKNETTFRIGGTVKKAAFPKTVDELVELLSSDEYDMVLGNCSNVLFSSGNCNKKIIITKQMSNFRFDGNLVTVEAGAKGPFLAKECLKRGLSGFEFLIGFPGSFGGMLAMNASAHNQSISDTFVCANVFDKITKKIIKLNKDEMKFSYRHSLLSEGNLVMLEAQFLLTPDNPEKIKELTERNVNFRLEHQPSLTKGNAGSTFRNPENDSAGRLLDLCGMKGEKIGGAKVFERHANFVTNDDNATSTDVINLMYEMYSRVKNKYGIKLKPEVIYIGEDETEIKLWREMTQKNIQPIQK